ncbi:MAG: hypothetical protein HKN09_02365 [Saprospiraceae bacterium]|nr:hypothetical protein [Saprospiraceae bacterium]
MKKLLLCTVLVLGSLMAYTQERIPVDLDESRLYLNLFVPSFTLEQKISANQSLLATAGLRLYGEEQFEEFEMSMNPFVELEFRNYYPRKKVKKELRQNSGNFIGVLSGYIFNDVVGSSEIDTYTYNNDVYLAGVWGIQRNYQSGIHLNLKLGPMIQIGDGEVDGNLYIHFGLGIQLGQ